MSNTKSILKHYAKRAVNYIRYPNRKGNRLVILGWKVENQSLSILYQLGGVEYQNKIIFNNVPDDFFQMVKLSDLKTLVAHIAFIWAPVFFKVDYIDEVYCDFLNFDKDWIDFHEYVIKNRLGEFRFLQGLNFEDQISVLGNPKMEYAMLTKKNLSNISLVLNGGGKDSTTTMEILKDSGVAAKWFTVGLNEVRRSVVEQSGMGEGIHIRYFTDDKIRSNAKFSYTPLSGPSFYSSVAFASSYILGFKYIVLSNEFSANEPNIILNGVEINHQFSKSFSFEKRYSAFISTLMPAGVEYFSFLRPLYELAIVREFSKLDDYFDKFVSCNIGISKGKWCCNCEKCAFIYLCLGAFLENEKTKSVFGQDLLVKPKIRKIIIHLCSEQTKAWECVGVRAECQLALKLLLDLNPKMDFKEYPYRKDLEKSCNDVKVEEYTRVYLESYNTPNLLPEHFEKILKSRLGLDS